MLKYYYFRYTLGKVKLIIKYGLYTATVQINKIFSL